MRRIFGIKRIWPWPLLFILAFSVFSARLWLNQFFKNKILELANAAEEMGISLNGLHIATFPPAVNLDSIEIPIKDKILTILRPSLVSGFFPPALHFSAQVLDGAVQAVASLEMNFPPRISRLDFILRNLSLETLFTLTSLKEFATINSGKIDGNGKFAIAYINSLPNWNAVAGEASLNLNDGGLTLKFPLLKTNDITNIQGNINMRINKGSLELSPCKMTAASISFKALGKISSCFYPKNSRLQLNTELRIPADLINAALLPERTMAMIDQKGLVRTKISGTLLAPKIYLEN